MTAYGVLVLAVACIFWAVLPSIGAHGYLTALDSGGHLLRAHYWARKIFLSGHFFGWFPLWYGGFDLYHVYPTLFYWLLGPLTLVMNKQLALSLACFLLSAAIVPAIYYFLRCFGLSILPAAVGAALGICLDAYLSFGVGAIYSLGLLPNALGFILAIVTAGNFKKSISSAHRTPSELLKSGMVFALLIFAHPFCAYWFVWISICLMAAEISGGFTPWREVLKRGSIVLALGLILSSSWWVGFILNRDQMLATNPFNSAAPLKALNKMIQMKYNGGWAMTALAALGVFTLFKKRNNSALIFFLSSLMLTGFLTLGTFTEYLPFGSEIHNSQRGRFEGFFYFLMISLAANGLSLLIRPMEWRAKKNISPMAKTAVAFFIATSLIYFKMDQLSRFLPRLVSSPSTESLPDLLSYLDKNARPGDFLLSEDSVDRTSMLPTFHFLHHNLALENLQFQDWSGGLPEGTTGAIWPTNINHHLDDFNLVETARSGFMKRGIRFIVSCRSSTASTLSRCTWLSRVWTKSSLALFEVKPFTSRFGLPVDIQTSITSLSTEKSGATEILFDRPVTLPSAMTMAVNYHPWIRVRLDHGPVEITSGLDNLLEVEGDQQPTRSLMLTFEIPWAFAALKYLVGLIWLLGSFWLLSNSQRSGNLNAS